MKLYVFIIFMLVDGLFVFTWFKYLDGIRRKEQ